MQPIDDNDTAGIIDNEELDNPLQKLDIIKHNKL